MLTFLSLIHCSKYIARLFPIVLLLSLVFPVFTEKWIPNFFSPSFHRIYGNRRKMACIIKIKGTYWYRVRTTYSWSLILLLTSGTLNMDSNDKTSRLVAVKHRYVPNLMSDSVNPEGKVHATGPTYNCPIKEKTPKTRNSNGVHLPFNPSTQLSADENPILSCNYKANPSKKYNSRKFRIFKIYCERLGDQRSNKSNFISLNHRLN